MDGTFFKKSCHEKKIRCQNMNVPEAVGICLLLNSLLNMHYFSVLFRWARHAWSEGGVPDTQQERVQEKCVVSGTPSLIRVAFVHLKNKKKSLLCRPVVKKWRWSQERFIFDGPTEIETYSYHFNLQNVTWLVDQSIILLRQILVKPRSNQRLLLQCL